MSGQVVSLTISEPSALAEACHAFISATTLASSSSTPIAISANGQRAKITWSVAPRNDSWVIHSRLSWRCSARSSPRPTAASHMRWLMSLV